jgi:hypothetical protein
MAWASLQGKARLAMETGPKLPAFRGLSTRPWVEEGDRLDGSNALLSLRWISGGDGCHTSDFVGLVML